MSIADAVERAERNSPFLRGLIRREPELLQLIQSDGADAALAIANARIDPEHPMASLRQARAGVALTVAIADLAGLWTLERVTAALTDFADLSLQFALKTAFAERNAEPDGMVALALGKMGSHELNYSSDIDLIIIHDPDRLARSSSEEPTDAAVRIVRRMVALLAERTADGYAHRVDLRLRPDPDTTPSSLPLSAALHYYQSEAVAWERSAFIRARPAGGDLAMGAEFIRSIEPFIWRRSLDYSAIAEIGDMSHRIRDHFAERQQLGPGYDLKRGRGGIREIEFHAQVLQLIFGGRDLSLRSGNTVEALFALADAGRLDAVEASELADCYRCYRTLEHRIQMLQDQQTHSIPKQAADRKAVAGLMGEAAWKDVEAALVPRVRRVAKLYDRLLASSGEERRGVRLPHERNSVEAWAKKARIADPALFATLAEGWRSGRHRSLRAPESRRAFEAVIPDLASTVGSGQQGRDALLRLDRMIIALPSGVQFWRLLAANPSLAAVVGRILTTTPLLADALAKRPALLDSLLEPAYPMPDAAAALAILRQLTRGLHGEALLDRVRIWTAEHRFLVGVQLMDGSVPPLEAGRTLGLLAEATVALLAEKVEAEFAEKHGRVPGAGFVTLALGRFGGGELTHQSDLDLVLLFTGSFEAKSDGPHPLAASSWFNRLGQRLIAALTVPTAAGALYEVDTRLRPSGKDGLLVVSLDSFLRYSREEAEYWEAMALTRARPVSGLPADRAMVESALDDLARRERPADMILKDVLAMRKLMASHKPAAGPFDVKLLRGGLVDIEFIVQTRSLLAATPIPAPLPEAVDRMAPELGSAVRLMMAMLVMLRLMQPHDAAAAPGPAEAAVLARACGYPGIAALRADLKQARGAVDAAWIATFARKY